jgi:uncharacterized integral membrane protein
MTSDPSVPPDQPGVGASPPAGPGGDLSKGTPPDPVATPGEYLASPESAVKFTRAAALWSALIVGLLILIFLLVFILQNTDSTTIHFFGWEWNLPAGVAILFAAVCGGLLTVAAGTLRIYQLRRAAKRYLKSSL